MSVTDVHGHGGLAFAGSATTAFTGGDPVVGAIVVEWDFGLGLEDITSFLYEAESLTGRDWPSQLQGKAGPGRLQLRLDNRDNRFSYFNPDSPLNQGGRSLDPGAMIRIRTDDATDVDPIVLARDRFDGTGGITTDELGTTWEHQTGHVWARVDGNAVAPTEGAESLMILDTGETDYYVQATIAELGDNVEPTAQQTRNTVRLIYRWQDSSNYSYVSYGPASDNRTQAAEVVDVAAGTPSTIYGPTSDVTASATDREGDHRRRVTLGVHVAGAVAAVYVNGALLTTETALQTDETHVGLFASYGLTNRQPAIDEFAVWDRFPTPTEGVIWTGHVVDVFPTAPAPGAPNTATVTAEGVMAQAAGVDVAPQPWAGRMRTGVAMGEAIQRAGLLHPPGEIALGDGFAGSSSNAEINALTHCRKLEEVEAGFLHEAPEGWLVFRERSYRDGLPVAAVFSDAAGAQFNYDSFELLNWRREIINKVSAGVSYGAPRIIAAGASSGATATGVARTVIQDFPASTETDDLFVIFAVSTVDDDSENWLVPVYWVRERDTGASSSRRAQLYTHVANAIEASTTTTFYNDTASAGGSYITVWAQIRNWYGTHEGIHIGTYTGDPGTGADPDPILPPWGDTNPSLFLAFRGGTNLAGAGSITNPVYPVGYGGAANVFRDGISSNNDDCGIMFARKEAIAAIEDPSTFAGFAGLQNAETGVVAIRGRNGNPPEPRGRLRVEVADVDSQRRHGVVASYDGCDLFPDEDTAEEWCELMLTRYARVRPVIRFSFTATLSAAYRAQAYKRRLGDKIRVVATGGTGMGIDADFHIESIRHAWVSDHNLWRVTWELSPAG